jgi:hypothetical protein
VTLGFKKTENSEFTPSVQKLLNQLNSRWPKRNQSNPEVTNKQESRQSLVSKNLAGRQDDANWFANQLVAYCKNKKPGSIRVSIIQNEEEIASGNHTLYYWTWRNWSENIGDNIKITFATQGEDDSMEYDIPILVNGESDIWSGEKPFFDRIVNSIYSGSADRSVWNLACRLKELGFIEEPVLPEGRQKYPKVGIRNLQNYMGLVRTEYNEELHRNIWGEFRLSINTP